MIFVYLQPIDEKRSWGNGNESGYPQAFLLPTRPLPVPFKEKQQILRRGCEGRHFNATHRANFLEGLNAVRAPVALATHVGFPDGRTDGTGSLGTRGTGSFKLSRMKDLASCCLP